jgi:hypothetical protein
MEESVIKIYLMDEFKEVQELKLDEDIIKENLHYFSVYIYSLF